MLIYVRIYTHFGQLWSALKQKKILIRKFIHGLSEAHFISFLLFSSSIIKGIVTDSTKISNEIVNLHFLIRRS